MQFHCGRTSLSFGYLDEVDDFGHLARRLRIVGLNGYVSDFAKSQRISGRDMRVFASDKTFYQLDLKGFGL